jgi:colanic acid biosynthesis protein WcaH
MLDDIEFKTVINSTPLVSIDILPIKNGKVLLGKRINKPAQGYYFSPGGRIYKNETINDAMTRIAKDELNVNLKFMPTFIGIFEHFYKDSIFFDVSTHYINLAYELKVQGQINLPTMQHEEYKWFSIEDLLDSNQVHKYVKDYIGVKYEK